LNARRADGGFSAKSSCWRLLQAFNTVYILVWPTARFGLSPPTSTGKVSRLSPLRSSTWPLHRCGFDGIILAALGGKDRKVWQLGILFGTAQVRHQRWQRIRVPGTGSNPEASWQRLRRFRDGPRESTLISVTASGSATTLCPALSVVRRAQRILKSWHFAQSAAALDGYRRLGR
jgi:hypothetical protein